MNIGLQKAGAWAGFWAMSIFFLALIIMGFLPALPPSLPADEAASYFQNHANAIRAGGLLMIIAGALAGPFDAVLYLQLRRIEGTNRPVCSIGQLASGIANIQFFVLPGVFFVIAAFRPDRQVDVQYALYDIAWLVTMFPWTVGAMQCLCIGLGILKHGNAQSPYPRWLGFFNIWIAVGMASSSVVPFFKTGPFAWNGLVGFWIPATVFGVWMGVMWWMSLKAIAREDAA